MSTVPHGAPVAAVAKGGARPLDGTGRPLGHIATLWRLFHATRYQRPGTPPLGLRRTSMHFLRCAADLDTFRDWFGSPALRLALAQRPSLATCVLHPYLNVGWSRVRKVAVIRSHYEMLCGRLGFLRFAPSASITLADFGDGVQIRLDKPGKFEHEGELTLNLFEGEMRIFSLVFTLGEIGAQRVAYVGALQGLDSPLALEIIRSLTGRMEGWRPRDVLVTSFRFLCRALEVERILAISDGQRVSSHPYFPSHTLVFSSYDSAWTDNGGSAGDDGFFELSPQVAQRTHADIPARKRALYRRRYELADGLAQQIDTAVWRACDEL